MDLLIELELQLVEEVSQYILEDSNGFYVWLIKVDPNLNSEAGGVIRFWWDIPEAINLITSVEIGSQDKKCQLFIDLLFIGLCFGDLEDKPSSFLILLILPFGLDAFFEELDGVDFAEGFANEVAE